MNKPGYGLLDPCHEAEIAVSAAESSTAGNHPMVEAERRRNGSLIRLIWPKEEGFAVCRVKVAVDGASGDGIAGVGVAGEEVDFAGLADWRRTQRIVVTFRSGRGRTSPTVACGCLVSGRCF